MWQQTYTPIGDSLALSALVAAIPIFTLLLLLGVLRKPAWMASLAGLAAAVVVAAGVYGMPAGIAGQRRHVRRRLRPLSHRLGRLQRDPALPHHARERQIRNPEGLHRPPHHRLAPAGAADRLRLRRVHRRRGGLRHAGGSGRRHAHRPRLRTVLRRRHLPAGQHRARGLRLHRHSHHHPRRHHRPAARPPERRRRPHLRPGLALRAGLPDPGDERLEGPARRAARRRRVRHRLRRHAVLRLQLRGAAAHRHSVVDGGHGRAAPGHQAARRSAEQASAAARSCSPGRPTCCWSSSCCSGPSRSRPTLNKYNIPVQWPGLHNVVQRMPPVVAKPAPYAGGLQLHLALRLRHRLPVCGAFERDGRGPLARPVRHASCATP